MISAPATCWNCGRSGDSDTVMLPFTATTVPVVDIAGRRIVIDPPQGLFKA